MNGDDLQRMGLLLFGSCWQSDLAEALGVSDRTVRRWRTGAAVPDGVVADIARLIADKRAALGDLLDDTALQPEE